MDTGQWFFPYENAPTETPYFISKKTERWFEMINYTIKQRQYDTDLRASKEKNRLLLLRIERLERLFVDLAPAADLKNNRTEGERIIEPYGTNPLYDGAALIEEIKRKNVKPVLKYANWGDL